MELLLNPLNEENLLQIKAIEGRAYENTPYAQMQRCTTWEDIANYMECEVENIRLHGTDTYYVLCAERESEVEIVDLASKDGRANLKAVITFLEAFDKPLTMDSRETTSYPIVKYMEKRKRLVVLEDESYQWAGEPFHSITAITTKALERNPSLLQEEVLER